jgi:hypothetical protein
MPEEKRREKEEKRGHREEKRGREKRKRKGDFVDYQKRKGDIVDYQADQAAAADRPHEGREEGRKGDSVNY